MPIQIAPKQHSPFQTTEKAPTPSEPLSNLRPFQICRHITRHFIFPLLHGRSGIAPPSKIPIGRDLGRLKTPRRTATSGKSRARLISSFFFAALFSGNMHAQESVNITWNTDPNPEIAGYTVYLGTQSGHYSVINDIGNSTKATLSPLIPSTTYYCAVQVYNTLGVSSALSPELVFTTAAIIQVPEIVVENSQGTDMQNGASGLVYSPTIPGTSSWPQSIILFNQGDSDLTGLDITIEGQNSANFTAVALGTNTLAPGASTSVDLTFSPESTGSHVANLQISSNDADESPFTISLSGTGAATPPSQEITIDASDSYTTSNPANDTVRADTYSVSGVDASGTDKLVVTVSSEAVSGTKSITGITYANISLNEAIQQNYSGGSQTTGIYYLDKPETAGNLVVNFSGNMNGIGISMLALSGTAPGVAVTSGDDGLTTSHTTTENGTFVVASHCNDGSGATAVTPLVPLFDGPVGSAGGGSGYQTVASAGLVIPSMTGSNMRPVTVAAGFKPAFDVPIVSDYDYWVGTYPEASDPDADSDGDGLLNNEERIWGLDPTSGASSTPNLSPLDKTSGIFSYYRRNPTLTGMNYRYEWSTRLDGDWTAFTPVLENARGTSPVETVDVTVDPALLSNPRLFIRIAAN